MAVVSEAISRPVLGVTAPILVVDDDPAIRDMVRAALQDEGYRVVAARDGEGALTQFRIQDPALVILDLTLPGLPGFDVCRTMRAESNVPIMVVSGRNTEMDRVAALEMGADDFFAKPFSVRELVSRVRAHCRRAGMSPPVGDDGVLSCGPVELDDGRHEVHVRGTLVPFTPKEFDLLRVLLMGESRLRPRGFLISEVWGASYRGDPKTLDVHVKRLRDKIELDPRQPEHIVTVRGLGYRFIDRR